MIGNEVEEGPVILDNGTDRQRILSLLNKLNVDTEIVKVT